MRESLSGGASSDIFVDGHVFLEAGKSALLLHGRDILGLEVNDTLLKAESVGVVEVLSSGDKSVSLACADGVHYYFLIYY